MKQNARWDPTRRPKNLPCRNLKTKGATILRLRKNKAKRLDSSQTKRDKASFLGILVRATCAR